MNIHLESINFDFIYQIEVIFNDGLILTAKNEREFKSIKSTVKKMLSQGRMVEKMQTEFKQIKLGRTASQLSIELLSDVFEKPYSHPL